VSRRVVVGPIENPSAGQFSEFLLIDDEEAANPHGPLNREQPEKESQANRVPSGSIDRVRERVLGRVFGVGADEKRDDDGNDGPKVEEDKSPGHLGEHFGADRLRVSVAVVSGKDSRKQQSWEGGSRTLSIPCTKRIAR
jgi:hypothetical protein